MIKATYIGPLKHLFGKTAIVSIVGDRVKCQFDDRYTTISGHWPLEWFGESHTYNAGWFDLSDTPPRDALGYGWYEFPKDQWDIEGEN